jgi:hypothetical protein
MKYEYEAGFEGTELIAKGITEGKNEESAKAEVFGISGSWETEDGLCFDRGCPSWVNVKQIHLYVNNNDSMGWFGSWQATSKESIADEMMETFGIWAKERVGQITVEIDTDSLVENEIDKMRFEFISGLEEVHLCDNCGFVMIGFDPEKERDENGHDFCKIECLLKYYEKDGRTV